MMEEGDVPVTRVCPNCSYEDDDPDTCLEPRCPMCNVDMEQALAEEKLKNDRRSAELRLEEDMRRKSQEEEAAWRERRRITEIQNAQTYDPTFLAPARRKSQISRENAARREEAAMRRRTEASLCRLSNEATREDRSHVVDVTLAGAEKVDTAKVRETNMSYEFGSDQKLLEFVSNLPQTCVKVHIIGIPKTPVGKTTVTRILQEIIESLQLSAHVTILADENFVAGGTDNVLSVCVYDVCNVKSFEYCVEKCCQSTNALRTVLVGNKIDLEYWRQVSVRRAASTILDINRKRRSENCGAHPVTFLEISAYTGLHIGYLVDEILRIVLSPRYSSELIEQLYDECDLCEDAIDVYKDPELLVYARLLKMGAPVEFISQKMMNEGVQKRVLLRVSPRYVFWPTEQSSDEYSSVSIEESSSDASNSSSSSDVLVAARRRRKTVRHSWGDDTGSGMLEGNLEALSLGDVRRDLNQLSLNVDKLGLKEKKVMDTVRFDGATLKKSFKRRSLPPPEDISMPPAPPPPAVSESKILAPMQQQSISQDQLNINFMDMRNVSDLMMDKRYSKEENSDDDNDVLEDEWDDDNIFLNDEVLEEELHIDGEDYQDSIGVDLEGGVGIDSLQSELAIKYEARNELQKMNVDMVFEITDGNEELNRRSENFQYQNQSFRTEKKKSIPPLYACVFCCCILCVEGGEFCAAMCRNCVARSRRNCFTCFASIKLALSKFFKRKSLMDNVLADTENAFQTLAKSLHYLIGSDMKFRCLGTVYYYAIGVWHKAVSWVVSYVLIVSATVVMILPSFFTLLIVRTSTIEKESKAFGDRQETIRHEKKEQSALRWLRIVLRSLPMSIYLLVVPYLMVYRLFPTCNNDQITYWVVGYLVGVILLQILGSVRVYHSWKSRDDTTIPAAPDMYYEEDVDEDPSARSCVSKCLPLGGKKEAFVSLENAGDVSMDQSCATQKVKRKTAVPIPPNTFTLSAGNMVVVLSLIVEYFQMASFPLQSNPLDGDSDEASSDGPGEGFPSASPTVEPASDFWGSKMFDSVYVNMGFDSDLTLTFMWVCVGMVCLLMLVFTNQFLFELRRYGNLLQRIEDKDSFFFSFTGAIVYGHGKPNNISKRMRLFVSLLSDTLFLVISMQLLTVLACDTVPDSGGERATLRAKESVECWEGEHALLSTCAMMAYAFYVPLSIMITPMLLEAPSTDSKDKPKEEGVAFLKLYLMTINVVKSVMLLVAVLGPQDIATLVLATALSSLLLGGITVAWYSKQDLSSLPYSSSVHPCNMAFINYWKAVSYTTSVVSAVIVVTFHSLQDTSAFVSERSLTDTLLTAWFCIAAVYASLYYQHYKRVKWRREVVSNLITYPFQWRDEFESARDGAEAVNLSWWSDDEEVEKRRHIPGFTVSPWHDYRRSGDGLSCTESVEEVNGEALSYRLLQRFRK